MQTDGELIIDGKKETVRGVSWMDHEFGSNQLGEDQVGWDWFSIQLDNNTELMLYLMRRKDGSVDPYSSGTLVNADGTSKHLDLKDYRVEVMDRWKSPSERRELSDEMESDDSLGEHRAGNQSRLSRARVDH